MKVLFAVNNDEISNAIVKRYQKDFKEILSYKNVYYFNAILKELQKDKTYDRVVISEDLEPFANNNYDAIDRFLFEKLDSISDEATNAEGDDTDIIFICGDRRNKSDEMLSKFFGIGIYNAIVGQDRSTEEVCKLINKPRTKKEAKIYYKIDIDNINYQTESENNVSETEVQNILAHYKRLGRNEDKYLDSFNNIVSQYNDEQLKIIIRYLPIGVKAVLEEKSPKYQQLVASSTNTVASRNIKNASKTNTANYKKKSGSIQIKMLENESDKSKITKPIIVPTGVNKAQVKRLIKQDKPIMQEAIENDTKAEEILDLEDLNLEEKIEEKPKRGRGRPRKVAVNTEQTEVKPKRGRGRPRKNPLPVPEEEEEESVDLFNIDDNEKTKEKSTENENDLIDLYDLNEEETNNNEDDINLFDLDIEDKSKESDTNEEEQDDIDLFNINSDEEKTNTTTLNNYQNNNYTSRLESQNTDITKTSYKQPEIDFTSTLTKDKKIVCFVGTTKNGTSFIVNNAAHLLSSMGISTAILDMTKTKNAYYIYTNSEEQLMKTAKDSINKLKSGIADGVIVNKNLTVYTSLPEENNEYTEVDAILATLAKNYSVVLIDCDFDTPMEYFGAAQEVYLVQSMDVLTIQPLTAFLRNLQSKGFLRQEKLKIVINKSVNIRSVPIKTLIGGISKYNDPSMSYMKDLFDKDKVPYCVIPFEVQNYVKYLDALITCTISLNGYTKQFMMALRELCNMIYPLINRQTYTPRGDRYKSSFSTEMNDTLNKMKRRYQ